MSDDAIPTSLTDPVLKLAEYWLSADIMHEHLHEMRDAFGGVAAIDQADESGAFLTYMAFWLSALYVVAEGFTTLRLTDDKLSPLVSTHIDSLRLYRNATFHFQAKPDKHVQFHNGTASRLNWAEEMHEEFR